MVSTRSCSSTGKERWTCGGISKVEVLEAQAGEEMIPQSDKDNTTEPSAPIQEQSLGKMGVTQDDGDQMLHVHYGEAVTSFRQCLKRYNLHTVSGINVSRAVWYRRIQNNLPYHKGRAPGALHGGYSYSKMTLLNYLLPAYTGYRGSSRWKYMLFGGDVNLNSYMSATRLPFGGGFEEVSTVDQGVRTTRLMNYEALINLPDSWPGVCATSTNVNPVLEVELPYMSNLRFGFAKQANLTSATFNNYYHRLDANCGSGVNNIRTAVRLACFNSVGEDFNMFFFTGCPIAYREAFLPFPPS